MKTSNANSTSTKLILTGMLVGLTWMIGVEMGEYGVIIAISIAVVSSALTRQGSI